MKGIIFKTEQQATSSAIEGKDIRYTISRYSFGKLIEEFGSYKDIDEAERNVELLNRVDPFCNYSVSKIDNYK